MIAIAYAGCSSITAGNLLTPLPVPAGAASELLTSGVTAAITSHSGSCHGHRWRAELGVVVNGVMGTGPVTAVEHLTVK